MTLHAPVPVPSITQPFGSTGPTNPKGYHQNDAKGPKWASFGARTGYAGPGPYHQGVDYAAANGTDILAMEAGRVVGHIWSTARGSYILVLWKTATGQAIACYQHLGGFIAPVGGLVAKGQHIAESGHSGQVTGPHLHAEIRVTSSPTADWHYWQTWRAFNLTRAMGGGDLGSVVAPA